MRSAKTKRLLESVELVADKLDRAVSDAKAKAQNNVDEMKLIGQLAQGFIESYIAVSLPVDISNAAHELRHIVADARKRPARGRK